MQASKVGRIQAIFASTGLAVIRYTPSGGTTGVYRARLVDLWPDVAIDDWVRFEPSGFYATNIQRVQAPPCPVFKIDFINHKLIGVTYD